MLSLKRIMFFGTGIIIGMTLSFCVSMLSYSSVVDHYTYTKYIAITSTNLKNFLTSPEMADKLALFLENETGNKVLSTLLIKYCKEYKVDPLLALSVASVESNLNVNAKSRKNTNGSRDYGLFQLNNKSYKGYKVSELLHPENNIKWGVSHIAGVIESQPSLLLALYAYNAGTTRVKRGKIPESSIIYANKILRLHTEYIEKFSYFIEVTS